MEAVPDSGFPDGLMQDAFELGAVTHDSVRVWLRHPDAAPIRSTLLVDGRAPVTAAVTLGPDADWTGAATLRLPRPAPDAPFRVVVGDQQRHGRFSPLPDARSGLTFGFGSCNRPYQLTQDGRIATAAVAEIYLAMRQELARLDARFLLLDGDQVYSDELGPISIRDRLPGDEQHPPSLEEALAAYRRVSRGYFNQSHLRALRESLPTYMIWDDHDIFDNWGSRLEESPLDRCLFEAACRAYTEYQHARNPDATFGPPPYGYTFAHGDIGFLVLDVRGARDYRDGRLLGARQWAEITAFLGGEAAARFSTLFVVSSIPVAHVSRWVAKVGDRLGAEIGDSIRDRWCSAAFVESRDDLLANLFAWQTRAPHRQVAILSGDVHVASAFTIRQRRGAGVIQQFSSSALTTPLARLHRVINRVVVRAPDLFEPELRFHRHLLAYQNNYGVVHVAPRTEGGHRIRFTVRGWQPKSRRLATVGRVTCEPPT